MDNRNCQNCKKDFVIEEDDFSFYETMKTPPPTFCPDCRLERRLVWRNEHGLFRRTNNTPGGTGQLISIFPDSSDVTVYDHAYWWSDAWDASDYGQDYDFSKPFFQQFKELMHRVPLINLFDSKGVNTSYCNTVVEHKNCYMVTAGWTNEDSIYSNRISFCKETADSYICHKTEFGYDNVYCSDSYRLFYSELSQNCADSYFLYDCRGCTDCFMSSNLRSKSYCIRNQQYSKEEYKKIMSELGLDNYDNIQKLKAEFKEMKGNAIQRFAHLTNCTNVIGDNVDNSNNAYYIFDLPGGVEHAKYCNWGTYGLKDSYDTGPGTGGKSELTYEGISIGVANARCKFGAILWNAHDVDYAFNSYTINNCFGAISLRNKSYCILNKQYSKEEYEELLPKIIQHMSDMPYVDEKGIVYKYGEFMPGEISPFPYNATVAQDYMPITPEKARSKGYRWEEEAERNYTITKQASELPQSITGVDESILNEVIGCANAGDNKVGCTKAFRIVQQELTFYKRIGIPLPHLCPKCRHYERVAKKNPMKLWLRTCSCILSNHEHTDNCPNEFQTTYSPDRAEKVYCESCYQKEVL